LHLLLLSLQGEEEGARRQCGELGVDEAAHNGEEGALLAEDLLELAHALGERTDGSALELLVCVRLRQQPCDEIAVARQA
jgi:hypothetical protein